MSDIQRWTLPHDGYAFQSDDGGYVTYADHVAALLTQDRQHMEQQAAAVAYGKGREDAARDVEALRNRWNGQRDVVQLNAAVAAARGEQA